MWTRQHKNRKSGALIVPALAAAFLSYFGYHAFQGEFGIYAGYAFEARAAALSSELDTVRHRRGELEHRVKLLSDGSLEKDTLDEYARRALNLAHDNEIVIYRPVRAN
ncbi:septum formation initiator family protein [Mesorhizobium sp. Z1-4]|uniref:FtsB family cell division protein n=1 Tax=Mesorhizobium sp. Z1-4 TaxID=2448478 RepID=UPI000FDB1D9F|nr:septum formation initiator family protein [Mesorhizobium sp. Z1-4]